MSWILYVLLVLAVAGDILLAVVLAKVMHKNDEPQQKIDTADDFVRAVTPVLQSETDLLAEQLRAMQGESARTTTATLRDFSSVLAENQRQNAAASTARLESSDRAGAARQKAANDALLAQLEARHPHPGRKRHCPFKAFFCAIDHADLRMQGRQQVLRIGIAWLALEQGLEHHHRVSIAIAVHRVEAEAEQFLVVQRLEFHGSRPAWCTGSVVRL